MMFWWKGMQVRWVFHVGVCDAWHNKRSVNVHHRINKGMDKVNTANNAFKHSTYGVLDLTWD